MQQLKPFYLFGLFLCLNYSIYAQANYHEYTVNSESQLFFEDFDDNKNGWSIYDRQEIIDGKLRIAISGKYPSIKKIKINTAKDFEIETSFKIVEDLSGYQEYYNSIEWGQTDYRHSYSFGINSSNQYAYCNYNGEQDDCDLIDKKFEYINKGGDNKLTIRKIGENYYFFINEHFVNKVAFKPFFGNMVSFSTGVINTIEVDYLKVGYLKKDLNNYPPNIVIIEPDINNGFKVTQAKTIRVTGKAIDNDGVYNVTANGIEANLQSGGYFSVDVPLAVGNNTISVSATDTKMKSSTKTFGVKRKSIAIVNTYTTNEKRVALVFGNSNYYGAGNLGENPINDAKDIASTLKSIGFSVVLKTDATLSTMNMAIRDFGRQNKDADVALFYFAGHGMQVERINYVLPIGVEVKDKNDVNFECVSVATVQKLMETGNSNRLNLIILDACRNNPFRTWQRGGETGLADMTPPSGTLIAFATSPGSTASNGSGRNGLYTGALIKELNKSQRIEDVFINTRIEVERKSGGRQSPWELARLRGAYYLKK